MYVRQVCDNVGCVGPRDMIRRTLAGRSRDTNLLIVVSAGRRTYQSSPAIETKNVILRHNKPSTMFRCIKLTRRNIKFKAQCKHIRIIHLKCIEIATFNVPGIQLIEFETFRESITIVIASS